MPLRPASEARAPVDRRGVTLYLAAATAGALLVVLLLRALGGLGGPAAGLVYLFMATPALAAGFARWRTGRTWRRSGLVRWSWRGVGVGWALAVGMVAAGFGALALLGLATFEPSVARIREALGPGGNLGEGPIPSGFSETGFLLLLAAANLTVANVPGLLFGLGEELGWRDYLLPRLLPLGRLRAFVALGVAWWAWHLPLVLVQPGGGAAASVPLPLAILGGLAGAVAMGVVLGWLRYASGSIWPVALLHVAYNNASAAAFLLLRFEPSAQLVANALVPIAVALTLARTGRLGVVPSGVDPEAPRHPVGREG